jgi:hypothetical protein
VSAGEVKLLGGAMASVKEIRVTTVDGKNAEVSVEYEDGATHVAIERMSLLSPLDPAATKIQVANELRALGTDLSDIEVAQIIIEWRAT